MLDTIVIDVDGTLTDGKVTYTELGDELKSFDIKDGLILSALVKNNFKIIIVTGRESKILNKRMNELGIREVFQGVVNKFSFLNDYFISKKIDLSDVLYIGDDLNDIEIMNRVGTKACPADACIDVKNIADYVSKRDGGNGAVRDILEYYLKLNNKWEPIVSSFSNY